METERIDYNTFKFFDTFVDPITKKVQKLSISTKFSDTQIGDLTRYNIDFETMVKAVAEKELETSKSQKYIESITKYAKEHGYTKSVNVFINESHRSQDIVLPLTGFVQDCINPSMITNAKVCSALDEILVHWESFESESICHYMGRIGFRFSPYENDRVDLEVMCNTIAPWDSTDAIVYDEEDPTKCLLVTYNFVERVSRNSVNVSEQ